MYTDCAKFAFIFSFSTLMLSSGINFTPIWYTSVRILLIARLLLMYYTTRKHKQTHGQCLFSEQDLYSWRLFQASYVQGPKHHRSRGFLVVLLRTLGIYIYICTFMIYFPLDFLINWPIFWIVRDDKINSIRDIFTFNTSTPINP